MAERLPPSLPERRNKASSTPVDKTQYDDKTNAKSQSDLTMPRKDKVRAWSRKDVSRWLEKRNLVKFVPLFLRNGIVGADLEESRLSFLYEDDVTVENREQLLAEIYMLLHPDSPQLYKRSPPSPSLRPIHPVDRDKYQAALQVAKSPSSSHASAPVVLITPRSRSPAAVTLTQPISKQRSRSESGLEPPEVFVSEAGSTSPSPGRKYLKRKSTPAVHDYLPRGGSTTQNSSLYDTFKDEGPLTLHSVRVERSSEAGSKFGFSYQTLPDGCLLVTNVRPSVTLPLHVGDRIVELNGMLLPGHKGSTAETVLTKAACLDVLVVRHAHSAGTKEGGDNINSSSECVKLKQELVMGEVRWQSLRHLLASMKQKPFDPMTLTGPATAGLEDVEDMKKRAALEMEVQRLQQACSDLSDQISCLQTSLKAKEQEVLQTQQARDCAVDTLRRHLVSFTSPHPSSAHSSHRHHHDGNGHDHAEKEDRADDDQEDGDDNIQKWTTIVRTSQDLHAAFFDHIDVSLTAMEGSDSTKEEVLAVLRELTRASQKHAQFVDRLLTFVTERAPWMMEEVNSLQDSSRLCGTAKDSDAVEHQAASALTPPSSADCDDAERAIVV